jgi:hypothetical protein
MEMIVLMMEKNHNSKKTNINTKTFLYLDMENETKKYILAHIKVPMEIKDDGTFETLPDYLTILFENLKELPSPSDNDYNNEYIKQQIKSLLNINNDNDKNMVNESLVVEKEIQPSISYDEINNRKYRSHKKNLSFKHKPHSLSRFTAKNYSSLKILGESVSSSMEKDAD